MAFILWTDKLSVNVEKIDDQHKKLVDMINNLSDAMSQGKGKDVIEKIICELEDYAAEHFAAEEKYLDKFHFFDRLYHKEKHKAFINKVSEFSAEYKNGNVTLSLSVMGFLKDWLINHIVGEDKQYTKCFNENGLY